MYINKINLLLSFFLACGCLFASEPASHVSQLIASLALPSEAPLELPESYRRIDGSVNNLKFRSYGAANTALIRKTRTDYLDGFDTPSGFYRPMPRVISNHIFSQKENFPNRAGASGFLWQWGQFIDHDIDLTESNTGEGFNIVVPIGDSFFDPGSNGDVTIPMTRSNFQRYNGVRQQVNEITHWVDASNVYGSTLSRSQSLRSLDGSGRLKVDENNLLIRDREGNFLAGDIRSNEQIALTAMHTLFVREHNLWADTFRYYYPNKGGDEVYELARAVVAAEMQSITYNEFLPVLLGPDALSLYNGYDYSINPSIANVFSTAAFRIGHTMLPSKLTRVDQNGRIISAGNLSLRDSFFNPSLLLDRRNGGLAPLLRGLASEHSQEIDALVIDDVRNFLFGRPGDGGFDLVSLNIQRGRDHGLPSYTAVRSAYGLSNFGGIFFMDAPKHVKKKLWEVYLFDDKIDPWVGMLAENHYRSALVGETAFRIIKEQFERLRDGDRYWYQRYLPEWLKVAVEKSTLSSIIRRNSAVGSELQNNVFLIP